MKCSEMQSEMQGQRSYLKCRDRKRRLRINTLSFPILIALIRLMT